LTPSRSPRETPSDGEPSPNNNELPTDCIPKPVDLCIAIDTSGSVCSPPSGPENCDWCSCAAGETASFWTNHAAAECCDNFVHERQYATNLINAVEGLEVDGNPVEGNQYGLVQFSYDSHKRVPSTAGLVPADNVLDYLRDSFVYSGGLTNTGDAIKDCHDNIKPVDNLRKVIVLVTDGKPTKGASDSDHYGYALDQADAAKYDGAIILPVQVNTVSTDATFLQSLGSVDTMIHVHNFNELSSTLNPLLSLIECEQSGFQCANGVTGYTLRKWDFTAGTEYGWSKSGSVAGTSGRSGIAGSLYVGGSSTWTSPQVTPGGHGSMDIKYKTCALSQGHGDQWSVEYKLGNGAWNTAKTHTYADFYDGVVDDGQTHLCREFVINDLIFDSTTVEFRLEGAMSHDDDYAYLAYLDIEFCPSPPPPSLCPGEQSVADWDFTAGTQNGWSSSGSVAGTSGRTGIAGSLYVGGYSTWTSPLVNVDGKGSITLSYKTCAFQQDSGDAWHIKVKIGNGGWIKAKTHEYDDFYDGVVDDGQNHYCREFVLEYSISEVDPTTVQFRLEGQCLSDQDYAYLVYLNAEYCPED